MCDTYVVAIENRSNWQLFDILLNERGPWSVVGGEGHNEWYVTSFLDSLQWLALGTKWGNKLHLTSFSANVKHFRRNLVTVNRLPHAQSTQQRQIKKRRETKTKSRNGRNACECNWIAIRNGRTEPAQKCKWVICNVFIFNGFAIKCNQNGIAEKNILQMTMATEQLEQPQRRGKIWTIPLYTFKSVCYLRHLVCGKLSRSAFQVFQLRYNLRFVCCIKVCIWRSYCENWNDEKPWPSSYEK